MSARLKVGLLVALIAVQLTAAAWSIARHERILSHGTAYRIRTAPIDPADAFRGRYVAVNPFIPVPEPLPDGTRQFLETLSTAGHAGYVVLTAGPDGFALAAALVPEPPAEGDYLRVHRAWPQWEQQGSPETPGRIVGYRLTFSFDRYYMNERAAPAAEARFREAARRGDVDGAWVTVRVRDGAGVIEGLFIDGVPIEALAATERP